MSKRAYKIMKSVTRVIEADVATVADKVTDIDSDFRAHKIVEGEVTKYLLDFGEDTPQIELIVDGDYINARFVVTE